MTLGLTSSGSIKIKTDNGGLRAVNCACCGPCNCAFKDGDIVKISALGKEIVATMFDEGPGFICYSDAERQFEDFTNITVYNRNLSPGATTGPCVAGPNISSYPSGYYRYEWEYFITGCTCEIFYNENINISDEYYGTIIDNCSEVPPADICCVCETAYESDTILKQGYASFPITGYGSYNVKMEWGEFSFPFCNPYINTFDEMIVVTLSEP
tara:strand:+ start:834 stop:1469 length:636 start_codon:yes stop_codon:yes gene_type:complete